MHHGDCTAFTSVIYSDLNAIPDRARPSSFANSTHLAEVTGLKDA